MVMNIDLQPTFLELAGAPPAKDIDGQSMMGLFNKPDAPWRRAALVKTSLIERN